MEGLPILLMLVFLTLHQNRGLQLEPLPYEELTPTSRRNAWIGFCALLITGIGAIAAGLIWKAHVNAEYHQLVNSILNRPLPTPSASAGAGIIIPSFSYSADALFVEFARPRPDLVRDFVLPFGGIVCLFLSIPVAIRLWEDKEARRELAA